MKRALLILYVLCCTRFEGSSQVPLDGYWKKANTAYGLKQYDSAIFYYERILAKQPRHAQVYYNLGNAFYKSNRVSEAVLSYERALFYEPGMPYVQDNLLLAKSRIPNAIKASQDIFFIRWWNTLTAGDTTNTWALLSLFVFLALLGAILLPYSKRKQQVPAQFYFFTPLLLLLLLYCSWLSAERSSKSTKAIVMGNAAAFTSAPGTYKGQSLIPEATTVETGEQNGSWIAVTLPDNRSGWMQKAELTFVQTNAPK